MNGSRPRPCARCGELADSLVVQSFPDGGGPGRVLVMCAHCRSGTPGERLIVVLPLAVLDAHPDLLMTALYREGVTESDPSSAAGIVATTSNRWVRRAERLLEGKPLVGD